MTIYILVYKREWLKTKVFYLAHLLMALLFLPVVIWNAQNGFVSFLFHAGRVEPAAAIFTPDYFLTEILGEALYTNPVILVLIVIAIVAFFKGSFENEKPQLSLLVWSALPLIITFLFVSIFRRTLPHWNGAGYMTLIPLAALWLRNRSELEFPRAIKVSLGFSVLLITLSSAQILTGFIPVEKLVKAEKGAGSADYSLEVYGWRQLGKEFKLLAAKYESDGLMPVNAPIVSYRWFPAANYSYYAVRGTGRFVLAAGDTSEIHKYVWINRQNGGFRLNSDAWFITSSRDFMHPRSLSSAYYEKVLPPDTISVMRMGKPAYYFYVYRLKNLQSKR
jgi:hypothetical protein